MTTNFASREDIDSFYSDAIANADSNDDIARYKVEQRQAHVDLQQAQLAQRERSVWRREALAEFPKAREFPDLLTGATEEQIRAQAAELHARVERSQPTQEELREQARTAYGPATVGGGSAGNVHYPDELEEFARRFNDPAEKAKLTSEEINAYVRQRGGEHLAERFRENARQVYGSGSRVTQGI